MEFWGGSGGGVAPSIGMGGPRGPLTRDWLGCLRGPFMDRDLSEERAEPRAVSGVHWPSMDVDG